jgi:hypothetical protein
MTTHLTPRAILALAESQKGPAERLLDLVLSSSDHLWHNRPGVSVDGRWFARRSRARHEDSAAGLANRAMSSALRS